MEVLHPQVLYALSALFLLFALFLEVIPNRTKFKFTNSKYDGWTTTEYSIGIFIKVLPILRYDKIQHFFRGVFFGLIFDWQSALVFSLSFEVQQAYCDYKKYGIVGGDGFSYKDLIAEYVGVLLSQIIKYVLLLI